MPYAMRFYQDQVVAGGASAEALGPAPRLLFVRHGSVEVNGERLGAGASAHAAGDLVVAGNAELSEIWRWELATPNAPAAGFSGAGIHSTLRLARAVTSLGLAAGGQWLFRLDRITSAPGRVTPRHRHHGPGIRCLYQGTFNVEAAAHAELAITPGQPWWESGEESVVAWHSLQMPAIFLRGMLLPPQLEGTISNIWMDEGPGPRAEWHLLEDRLITLD